MPTTDKTVMLPRTAFAIVLLLAAVRLGASTVTFTTLAGAVR